MPELTGLTQFDCDQMTDFLVRIVFTPLLEPGDRACFLFRNTVWSDPPPADPAWNLALVFARSVDGSTWNVWFEQTGEVISEVETFENNFQFEGSLMHMVQHVIFRMNGNEFNVCFQGDVFLGKQGKLDLASIDTGQFGLVVYGSGLIDLQAFQVWKAGASVLYQSVLSTRGRFQKDPSCFSSPFW